MDAYEAEFYSSVYSDVKGHSRTAKKTMTPSIAMHKVVAKSWIRNEVNGAIQYHWTSNQVAMDKNLGSDVKFLIPPVALREATLQLCRHLPVKYYDCDDAHGVIGGVSRMIGYSHVDEVIGHRTLRSRQISRWALANWRKNSKAGKQLCRQSEGVSKFK